MASDKCLLLSGLCFPPGDEDACWGTCAAPPRPLCGPDADCTSGSGGGGPRPVAPGQPSLCGRSGDRLLVGSFQRRLQPALHRACPSGAPSSGSCAERRAPFLSKPGALCDPIRRLVSLCWIRPPSDLRSSPHVFQKWMWPLEQSWLQNLAVMDGLGSRLLRRGGGGLLAGPGRSWTQPLIPGKQAQGAASGWLPRNLHPEMGAASPANGLCWLWAASLPSCSLDKNSRVRRGQRCTWALVTHPVAPVS